MPARWMAVRRSIADLHHAHLGIEPKTPANHRANVTAALAWFCEAADLHTERHWTRPGPHCAIGSAQGCTAVVLSCVTCLSRRIARDYALP